MTLFAKLLGWIIVWAIGHGTLWAWMLYFAGNWFFEHLWVVGVIVTLQLSALGWVLQKELLK